MPPALMNALTSRWSMQHLSIQSVVGEKAHGAYAEGHRPRIDRITHSKPSARAASGTSGGIHQLPRSSHESAKAKPADTRKAVRSNETMIRIASRAWRQRYSRSIASFFLPSSLQLCDTKKFAQSSLCDLEYMPAPSPSQRRAPLATSTDGSSAVSSHMLRKTAADEAPPAAGCDAEATG